MVLFPRLVEHFFRQRSCLAYEPSNNKSVVKLYYIELLYILVFRFYILLTKERERERELLRDKRRFAFIFKKIDIFFFFFTL